MGNSSTTEYLYPVGEAANSDETPAFRHPNFVNHLIYTVDSSVQTVQDVYRQSSEKYRDKIFLGQRAKTENPEELGEYSYKTYGECIEIAGNLGRGIKSMRLDILKQDYKDYRLFFVGVYSKNREEWALLDMACTLYGIVSVPIYDTLGMDAVEFVFEQTGLITVFCTEKEFPVLIKGAESKKLVDLRNIVIMDGCTPEQKVQGKAAGLRVYDFYEVVENGKNIDIPYANVKPDDIYTFSYTSGTTNIPKATMLSHQNLVSVIVTPQRHGGLITTSDDTYLSYLPLTHIMERGLLVNFAFSGAQFIFYNGDVQKLKLDLQVVKPTVFVSVPRLFNRFHDLIKDNLSKVDGWKKGLVEKAITTKLENLRDSGELTHTLYDKLVFNKTKDIMGGRVRYMLTGSAPISTDVLNFLKICFCCPIISGYGQTETSAASSLTKIGDNSSGSIGGPTPNSEIKLLSVHDMEYTVQDLDEHGHSSPRGQILIRGYGCIKEYYKAPDKTAETIDRDGWVHTGDIGTIKHGKLYIIDRKKNIFKLSQGEYVAPEKIEGVLIRHQYIAEAFIYGDSLRDFLVLIAVPKPDKLIELAHSLNLQGNLNDFCQNPQILKIVLDDIITFCRKEKLNGIEIPKKIHLLPESFQAYNLLTPTFKIKRHEAKRLFENTIVELYST